MWPTKEQSRFYGSGFAVEFYGPTSEEAMRSFNRTSAKGKAAQDAGRAVWRNSLVINADRKRADEPRAEFDGAV